MHQQNNHDNFSSSLGRNQMLTPTLQPAHPDHLREARSDAERRRGTRLP